MTLRRRFTLLLSGTLALLLIGACTLGNTIQQPEPTAAATPTSSPTITPESAWQNLQPGLQQRRLSANLSEIVALRIDPAQYTFRAHYRPGQRLSLRDWRETLPDAIAIINSNFYTEDYRVLGLLVSNGTVYGSAYTNRGGAFIVQDGVPHIRSNVQEPYRGENLEQAVQAFPMLVEEGAQVYTENGRTSRRTAIAQDASGRIILLATPGFGLSLSNLSALLADSELNIINAFNLDGGGSTMMHVGPSETVINSFDPVPAVLAVYRR